MKVLLSLAALCLVMGHVCTQCVPSATTASGTLAPAQICSGQLLFEDNFDTLNQTKWRHEISLWGGGNNEFQWYVNDRSNSFVTAGNLHLKPTLTADVFGEEFLRSGHVVLHPDECTSGEANGCDRQGTADNIINPARSALVTSFNSFSFKFGIVEIRAKTPAGDWIWPALWMMPKHSVFGGWPTSGEIDIMESRANRNLFDEDDLNIGAEHTGSTLHFGPRWDFNGYPTSSDGRRQQPGFNEDFHVYRLEWSPSGMVFSIDGIVHLTIPAGTGFWDRGGFQSSGLDNPWAEATLMAPFDQEFYIIMNNAVGGTNGYFPDHFRNEPYAKPWLNSSPRAAADFWEAKSLWEPTWNRDTDDSHLQVDYVRVWAL